MIRRILVVLIAFALLGVATPQRVRAAQHISPVAMSCMPSDPAKAISPCGKAEPGCTGYLCCVTVPGLPTQAAVIGAAAAFAAVNYWPATRGAYGLSPQPDVKPLRTS